MLGAASLFALALVVGAVPADVKNPALAEGIKLYDANDYAGALGALTQALDKPSSKRDYARIHLYIGLIQHQFKLKDDAEASFTKALDYDPKVQAPKNAGSGAKLLFSRVQKAKLGRSAEPSEAERARAALEEAKRKKKDPPKKKLEEPAEVASSETRTATKAAQRDTADPRLSKTELANRGQGGAKDAGVTTTLPNAAPDGARTAVTTPATVDAPTRVAPWIAVGVGIAAVAAGTTLGIVSTMNGKEAETEPVASRAEELHDTAVGQRTFSIVAFGVGGAALGLAALLFWME